MVKWIGNNKWKINTKIKLLCWLWKEIKRSKYKLVRDDAASYTFGLSTKKWGKNEFRGEKMIKWKFRGHGKVKKWKGMDIKLI